MKSGAWAFVLVGAALAGCATGEGPNPNVLAPKLVLHQRPDGNVTVFVHSAFREWIYDWVAVSVDNQTRQNRTWTHSVEEHLPQRGFFLHVEAQAGEVLYGASARVDVEDGTERATVAFVDQEGWSEPREYGLPFSHIMDRPREGGA